MSAGNKCIKCGSTSLETGVVKAPTDRSGRIHFYADNTKFMTLQTGAIDVYSSMCLDCGFIELIGDVQKARSLTGRDEPS
ncbi:hypothetical protein AVDCRST_MAG81-4679 [uncultured Synechococcales cyanobacterium]|uniref:Uncharacterized protein n=1 Tax=uncultured Synechococcales cyanobacterium TaxID=1936017 RepID=A0A6J4VVK6_9CYAN|nr:hypothetical protein AVDCRST_MAG81-4679 [uncultured Synechococcales cyanobacterium]